MALTAATSTSSAAANSKPQLPFWNASSQEWSGKLWSGKLWSFTKTACAAVDSNCWSSSFRRLANDTLLANNTSFVEDFSQWLSAIAAGRRKDQESLEDSHLPKQTARHQTQAVVWSGTLLEDNGLPNDEEGVARSPSQQGGTGKHSRGGTLDSVRSTTRGLEGLPHGSESHTSKKK